MPAAMQTQTKYGAEIRRLRIARGYSTQAALAKALKVSQGTVSS